MERYLGDLPRLLGDFKCLRAEFEFLLGDFEFLLGELEFLLGDFAFLLGDFEFLFGDFECLREDNGSSVGEDEFLARGDLLRLRGDLERGSKRRGGVLRSTACRASFEENEGGGVRYR